MNISLIPDVKTGELIPIDKITPKQIKAYLETLKEKEVSELLSAVNFHTKISSKIEKTIKDWVKSTKNFELNAGEEIFYGDWKVKGVATHSFSEKKLMAEGTEQEKRVWEMLKKKYTENKLYIKFGA